MAEVGKPAQLKCRHARITLGKAVIGTSEKCGGVWGADGIKCNGKLECTIRVPTDHQQYHNCRESDHVAIFGTYFCINRATNQEVWTPIKGESKTDLYEGRIMHNYCPEGSLVHFFDSMYGGVGTCPAVDVTRALNRAVTSSSQTVEVKPATLLLNKNPCPAKYGVAQAALTTKGQCKGEPPSKMHVSKCV